MPSHWERIEEGIHRLQDSCHVYAVDGPEGVVLVNAGTGLAADHLEEIARGKPVTVLLTHHFRDHTDGAIRLHEKGGPDTRTLLGPGVPRRPGTALPGTAAMELLRQPVGPLLAHPVRAGRRLDDGLRYTGHRGPVVGGRSDTRHDQRGEQLHRHHRRQAHWFRR